MMKESSGIASLIERLDACVSAIRAANDAVLEQQAILYAAFLTDMQNGKIDRETPAVQEMVDLVEQFCQLVESTSRPQP